MAWFKYIGDPRQGGEGPPRIVLFSHSFERAAAVEVTGAAAIAKLEGNRHFEKMDGAAEGEGADAPQADPHPKGKPRARRKRGGAADTAGAA